MPLLPGAARPRVTALRPLREADLPAAARRAGRHARCSGPSWWPAWSARACWRCCPPAAASRSATSCPRWFTTARAGQLTVIVSPLQSLMKDQVDNLVAAGVNCAVTINGLLTPLERRAALDKIRLGDAGIVLVSPEQFRSRTFTEAIRMREIATWVFDEAHCLSKWGHDFRTDYLYVSRFIREHFAAQRAPVACFTATAKPDVIEDLCAHFREGLGSSCSASSAATSARTCPTWSSPSPRRRRPSASSSCCKHELKDGGAAVVFCATRKTAQTMSELVTAAGTVCGCFHGGLEPEIKKRRPAALHRGRSAGDRRDQRLRHGGGQARHPRRDPRRHPRLAGELPAGGRARRPGRPAPPAACCCSIRRTSRPSSACPRRRKLTKKDFDSLLRAIRNRVRRLKSSEIVVSAKELLPESEGTDDRHRVARRIDQGHHRDRLAGAQRLPEAQREQQPGVPGEPSRADAGGGTAADRGRGSARSGTRSATRPSRRRCFAA